MNVFSNPTKKDIESLTRAKEIDLYSSEDLSQFFKELKESMDSMVTLDGEELTKAIADLNEKVAQGCDLNFLGNHGEVKKRKKGGKRYFKGIVDGSNNAKIFNVVSDQYKIAQHEEVYEAIQSAIEDSGYAYETKVYPLDDGERMRIVINFPEISFKVGDDSISLRMVFDNSYNSTTGLRACVEGTRPGTPGKDPVGMSVPDRFSRYYHKHTMGMDIAHLKSSVEKGIRVFNNSIRPKWESYANQNIDSTKATIFLEGLLGDDKIAKKYLNEMIRLNRTQGSNTQWDLFKIVTEVMSINCGSPDKQQEVIRDLDNRINSAITKIS